VLVVLLAPAGLLNQLPTPSFSMSSGPASFSAYVDMLKRFISCCPSV